MEIYILRHGTTEWNSQHRIQGSNDIALDTLGLRMAEETGKSFRDRGIGFDRVYSSPLSRAKMTSLLVSGFAENEIITDERLKELNFGFQEGHIVEEMVKNDVLFQYFKEDPIRYNILSEQEESTESIQELMNRTEDFMKDVIEKLPADTGRVLISAHGAANKALLMYIRGESDLGLFWGDGLQPNCGFDIAEYDASKHEYRILDSNIVYYSSEIMKKAPKLL